MKTLNNIVKVLTALAAVAGAVYIVATYGEQIVAWAKKMLNCLPKCPECKCDCKCDAEAVVDVTAEETAAEEAPAEEPAAEEVPMEEPVEEPAPEIVVAENEPVADESDFAE